MSKMLKQSANINQAKMILIFVISSIFVIFIITFIFTRCIVEILFKVVVNHVVT